MATTPNYITALKQYDVALAAYQALYGELTAKHVQAIGCGREALSGENHGSLATVGAFVHLDQKSLNGQLTLLCAQTHDVPAEDLEAAISGIHAKLAALDVAKKTLVAARATLDAVFTTSEAYAKDTCHQLTELLAALKKVKK